MQVDAVQQRAGDLAAVTPHLVGAAVAATGLVAVVATRTGLRCLFAICPRFA
jgi:hypothetical protein